MSFLVKTNNHLLKHNFHRFINALRNPNTKQPLTTIFHNESDISSAQFLQINKDTIELVFDNANEEYQEYAKLCTGDRIPDPQFPEHLIPTKVFNGTYCGAGAIVYFDRKKWLDYVERKYFKNLGEKI